MEGLTWKKKIWRNLCCWGGTAEKLVLCQIFATVIYTVIFSGSFQLNWDSAIGYATMLGVIFSFMIPVSIGAQRLSVVISLGSGRKEAVFGMQLMNLLMVTQMAAVGVLCMLGEGGLKSFRWQMAAFYFFLLLFAGALGQVMAVVYMYVGMKGIVIFLIALAGVAIFALCSIFWFGDMELIREFIMKKATLLGGIAAILLYALSVFLLYRRTKTYEVRV